MTWFLRNAFLALVAFAVLAIIVMMAVTAEASLKPNTIPAAAATSAEVNPIALDWRTKTETARTVSSGIFLLGLNGLRARAPSPPHA